MFLKYLLLFVLLLWSCQERTPSQKQQNRKNSVTTSDELPELEEKNTDASCETEEDLQKEISRQVEKAKRGESFQLQGGNKGCRINE